MNTANMVRARNTPASMPKIVSKASTPSIGYSTLSGMSRSTMSP